MRKNLPSDPSVFISLSPPSHPNYKIVEVVESGNNGHVFKAYSESLERSLACKVVPVTNLSDEWLDEAKKPNGLTHPAVIKVDDVAEWKPDSISGEFVAFIYEYVNGPSLRSYIKSHKNEITVGFVERFMLMALGLLHEMKGRGVEHGDLHSGNIIVADPDEFDLEPEIRFRVTDFGVLAVTTSKSHSSDFLYIAGVLRELLENVDYQSCDGRDKYVFNILRNDFLQRHMIDTDPLADALKQDTKQLFDKLRGNCKTPQTYWINAD